ncbi:recombinase family protein [Streptomyces enissocaesilis]|uniref:Resolvase/invertase-type recombinase catalytic domain-containing protein n=1 Tax=Streptomyces enissocaesilis TaxID=332589 RepID=A0ABN3X7T9_9ACTN
MTEPQAPVQQAPLAFIYDRHATATKTILGIRIEDCRTYATLKGWEVAGVWIDEGYDALGDDHRPEFDGMCRAMEQFARSRRVICLAQGWDRFSRDETNSASLRRRIAAAGGYCETASGETDPPQAGNGRLTTPAIPT